MAFQLPVPSSERDVWECTLYADGRLVASFAAYANNTGSLTMGKRFDAVIWDDDLMTVDHKEMQDVRAKTTILDGQIVFGSIPA